MFLLSKINGSECSDKELITKLMFGLGKSKLDRSAFNLFVGCQTQWDFFGTCVLPDAIPQFASPKMLSRPLTRQTNVSWEKVMIKLDQALETSELTDETLMRAMLACRILVAVETKEINSKRILRLGDDGRRLLNTVLPFQLSPTRVWPASSMLFYVIFRWMKRASLLETAAADCFKLNRKRVAENGYELMSLRLDKPDTIEVTLTKSKSSCTHALEAKSTWDPLSGNFWITPSDCPSCPSSNQETRPRFPLNGGQLLNNVMIVCKIFETYVLHNNHVDIPREMLVATTLYLLQFGSQPRMRPMDLDHIDTLRAEAIEKLGREKPDSIALPSEALDYRTPEGRQKRRKKTAKTRVSINLPNEVQTIKTYIDQLKRCEADHQKQTSKFQSECDAVVDRLMHEKAQNFDLSLEKIPIAMELNGASPVQGPSNASSAATMSCLKGSRKRKRCALGSDDEDDDADLGTDKVASLPPPQPVVNPETTSVPRQDRVGVQDDVARSVPNPIPFERYVPLSAAVTTRVEHVLLQESKSKIREPSVSEEESDSSDSESDSDSEEDDGEEEEEVDEKKKDSQPLARQGNSPLNTPIQHMASLQPQPQFASPSLNPSRIRNSQNSPSTKTRSSPNSSSPNSAFPLLSRFQGSSPTTLPVENTNIFEGFSAITDQPSMQHQQLRSEVAGLSSGSPRIGHQRKVGEDATVEDLFNGDVASVPTTVPLLDPLSSELVARNEIVRGTGTITVGPVSVDTARRGLCVTKIMREVGLLDDIVPRSEMVTTYNGEVAFCVWTEHKSLYSLATFPGEWTSLQACLSVLRAIVMAAALQSLDLSRFVVTDDDRVVMLPAMSGRIEMRMHPLELLQRFPEVGRRFREAVRADIAEFAAWVRGMSAEKRKSIETIVRDAGLLLMNRSKTIDLDYFCRFFDEFISVLPWLEGK